VNCASFRSDGELLVAGSEDGVLSVFETKERRMLRVFKGHERYNLFLSVFSFLIFTNLQVSLVIIFDTYFCFSFNVLTEQFMWLNFLLIKITSFQEVTIRQYDIGILQHKLKSKSSRDIKYFAFCSFISFHVL
jgi:hypothetical protein